MMNALNFAISVLALAAVCLAQDGLTVDNKHKERVFAPEVDKIYSSACSVVQAGRSSDWPSVPCMHL
jgi:hypothetical protein